MKWSELMSPETLIIGDGLEAKAAAERQAGKIIYPPPDCIFRALELTPPDRTKVVIVGQDPYINHGQANGLAFSVNPGIQPPPSLVNIFDELVSDLGVQRPTTGDLTPWAEQGVLLLNASLTVEAGKSNSHINWGWHGFTHEVFRIATTLPQPIVFILWGNNARSFVADLSLDALWHLKKACVASSHPSPMSAYKGNPPFFGSRPFSKANQLLQSLGASPVDWRLP